MRLQNKVAVITGAASGFGAGTARLFATEGAAVVVADISDEAGESVVDSINTTGGKAVYVHADVTSRDDTRNMIDAAEKLGGRLDILINNAGGPAPGDFRDWDRETWIAALDANMLTAIFLIKATVDGMIERRFGRIVNIGSINGQAGQYGQVNYAAAKSGIHGFTKALAQEGAAKGITVNAICPGGFMTEPNLKWASQNPAIIESFKEQIPAGDFGQPEDLGPLAVYLASDAARYVTGASIVIDGGYTLW